MKKINFFLAILICSFSLNIWCQRSIKNDPELIQNSINYRIEQAKKKLYDYNYYETQKKLDEALTLSEKIDNKISIGIIYLLKGKLQLANKEADEAIKSLNKAIEIQQTINDTENLGKSYKVYADVFIFKKDYFSALNYYKIAATKFQENNLKANLAEALLSEGKTYYYLKDFKKASEVIEQSITLAKEDLLIKTESEALIFNSLIQNKLKNNDAALSMAIEGVSIAKENNFLNILNNGFFVLSNIYNDTQNYKLSREFLKAHVNLSDSLRNLKNLNTSKTDKTQYLLNEATQKNTKIEKELQQVADYKRLGLPISILSIALIIMLSLLALSLYKNNKMRLITNTMLYKKNEELTIAKDNAELASRTKANFLSTVTHELRTPLYTVTGLSTMLLEENPKPEQIQHLKSLKFSGDYLLTFINDILEINKIEAKKIDIEAEPFNLKKLINSITLSLVNTAKENNVKLHFKYPKNLPKNFIADQIKISQILINLIGNAIKFTKNGDVWIRVNHTKIENTLYTLRFEIEDNGIGISPEKQENMFESFSQGSIQINRKYGGTGLGLSIVKGLIDILNGKIYVKSILEKGTQFYFEIPLEHKEIKKDTEETKSNYFARNPNNLCLENIKILIVEDHKINQMITKNILEKINIHCDIIDNGKDAVTMIKNTKYDIVLMDIHMPDISGIETTKIVRLFDKEQIIFALTAVTIEDKKYEFEDAGFNGIIPKPFKKEDLEQKMYYALALKQGKLANA